MRDGKVPVGAAEAPPGLDQAREWLQCVEPRPQDQRARVAFALFDGWGDAAEPVFTAWLRGHPEHDADREREGRTTWRSARKRGPVTWRALRGMARDMGWRPDPNAPPQRRPSPDDLARQQAARAARATTEAAEQQRKADVAAAQAVQRLAAAAPANSEHPYPRRKGVAPTPDMRQEGAALLVPFQDRTGAVRGLQIITADGHKRFQTGASVTGCWWWAHPPTDAVERLFVTEGVATGLSIAAATDYPVAVAFNASNLPKVAAILRELFPTADIIIAADADANQTGQRAAEKAAAASGGIAHFPTFTDGALIDKKPPTDWNDLQQLEGLTTVRRQLLDLPAALATNPAAENPHGAAIVGAFSLPQVWPYSDGAFIVRGDGVHYSPPDDAKGNSVPARWICGPLRIIAQTRDPAGSEWGRLLEWANPDGQPQRWAVPLELLQGDGADVRRELARRGLAIATSRAARELLAAYIQAWPVDARARCVDRLGWIGPAYVLPDQVIGTADGGEEVVFQGKAAAEAAHAVAGTLDDWRSSVAAWAAGNTRLVFAIAASLAGSLLHLVVVESGGFHLRGRSSSGKSTALFVGASVWGGPAFVRSWRATASGIEGVALLHNDSTLFLDELFQIDPRLVGELVYLLANQLGKARSSPAGTARPTARWRLLFMSTGELSLEAQIAASGRRIAAGQEVRLADIEADAGFGMGVFQELHGHPSPAALALALKDAAARFHGAVGVAWLRVLVAHRAAIARAGQAAVAKFAADVVPAGASGQAGRVARRFGLVAVAGELATRAGLTGWTRGESTRAAESCFHAWLAGFGGAGDREERAILAQVREFFERHADRFQELTHEHAVRNRAGFYRNTDGVRQYLVLPGVFKNEVCAGLDHRTVLRVLRARGWIEPDAQGKSSQALHPIGLSSTRLYVFTQAMWSFEHG